MALVEIYNEDGIKQFDSDQLPFVLRKKITLDASLDVGGQTMGGNTGSSVIVFNRQTITVDEPDAVLACYGGTAVKVASRVGSTWTIAYQRAPGVTIEIFVFGSGSVGSPNSLMAMYLEDGTLTFTADDLPMRPAGGVTYALANGGYQEAVVNVPGAKLAGLLVSSAQVRETEDDPEDQRNDRIIISQTFLRADSGGVTNALISYVTLRNPVSGSGVTTLNNGSFLAIDVTGF